jgi:hypothetical protein
MSDFGEKSKQSGFTGYVGYIPTCSNLQKDSAQPNTMIIAISHALSESLNIGYS